jgi:hypothetical protein
VGCGSRIRWRSCVESGNSELDVCRVREEMQQGIGEKRLVYWVCSRRVKYII